jgi:hypothetical protein
LRYRLDHGLRLGRRGRRLGLDEGLRLHRGLSPHVIGPLRTQGRLRLHRELRHVVELRLGLGLGHRRSLGRGLEDGRRLLQIIPDTLDVDVHLATLQLRAGLVVAGRRLQGLGPGADFRLVGLHLARRLGRCPLDVHHLVDAGTLQLRRRLHDLEPSLLGQHQVGDAVAGEQLAVELGQRSSGDPVRGCGRLPGARRRR